MILGRHAECARIVELLDAARLGDGGLLVIRGEAGSGKSTLLAFAREQAAGMTVLRASGSAGESELAFAGLFDLLRPAMGYVGALPEARAEALRGALGLSPGVERDRFAVGAATLSLLAAAAEHSPLLVAVDDTQWLDAASLDALLFASHRLVGDPIAVVLTERDDGRSRLDAAGGAVLALGGLDLQATARLAASATGSVLAPDQADRLYRLTAGNPLAVLEIGSHDAVAEPLGPPAPISARLEAAFRGRASKLTPAGQSLLLVVAADDSREIATVRRAADLLGLADGGLQEAEAAGLVVIGDGRVEFRHPLVRSAIYQSAAPDARRAAHGAIADALHGDWQAARRAWHRAAAALGPDEAVAAALEATAHDARARTGYAAAARAMERAASLTPDDESRARRECAAADAHWQVGQWQQAVELLDVAEERSADPLLRADAQLVRGRIDYYRGDLDGTHARLLEESARVAPLDGRRAAALAGAALGCAFLAADHETPLTTAAVAVRLVRSEAREHAARATPWLGAALLLIDEQAEARDFIEQLRVELEAAPGTEDDLYDLVAVATAYGWLCEFQLARDLATRALTAAREQGALSVVAAACEALTALHIAAGDLDAATAAADELQTIGHETGQPQLERSGAWYLSDVHSIRGEREACLSSLRQAEACIPGPISWLGWDSSACLLGRLHLGFGEPEAACAALEAGVDLDSPASFGICTGCFDLAEAYVRLGRTAAATETLERVAPGVRQAWCQAALERTRGLLAEEFDTPLRASIDGFGMLSMPFEQARSRLLYGERLRRAGRRVEAREQLRAGLASFERMRAQSWSERAREELRAAGETLPVRSDASAPDRLTPQELKVALIVADGATNREAAARLFLSVKTVEAHLHRAFRKLDVDSRDQLARILAPAVPDPAETSAEDERSPEREVTISRPSDSR